MNFNTKIDPTFYKLVKINTILTVIENIVFFLLGEWDLTVLAGSALGWFMVSCFFFMICESVPKILRIEEEADAKKRMKSGQMERTLLLGAGIVLALKVKAFNWIAALIPLLFIRISATIVGLKGDEE